MTPDWETEAAVQRGALDLAFGDVDGSRMQRRGERLWGYRIGRKRGTDDSSRTDPRLHNRVPPDLFQDAVVEEDEITGGEQTFHELYVEFESLKATFAFLERWREGIIRRTQENAASGKRPCCGWKASAVNFSANSVSNGQIAAARQENWMCSTPHKRKSASLSERAFNRAVGFDSADCLEISGSSQITAIVSIG